MDQRLNLLDSHRKSGSFLDTLDWLQKTFTCLNRSKYVFSAHIGCLEAREVNMQAVANRDWSKTLSKCNDCPVITLRA